MTGDRCTPTLAAGYLIHRNAIAPELVDAALRRLNLELRDRYNPENYASDLRTTFFAHARWTPEILDLQDAAAEIVQPSPGCAWADPQLLLRFPDDDTATDAPPHVDRPPEWAGARPYAAIVGVALSRSHAGDGCLAVWPGPTMVELDPGDIVVMAPGTPHAGTPNRGPSIRYHVYLRLLAAPPAPA